MAGLARFSASVDADLLEQFDRLSMERGFPTRSRAIETAMRRALLERIPRGGGLISGTVTLLFDHHRRAVVDQLLSVQHEAGDLVLCSQHVHLAHDLCLEVLIVRGLPESVNRLLGGLNSIKGLETSSLLIESGTGPR